MKQDLHIFILKGAIVISTLLLIIHFAMQTKF